MYREVEHLSLLLVGPALGDANFAHVSLGGGRLDGFSGAAVLEGVGHVEVFHSQHVPQCLHGGVQGLSYLGKHRRSVRGVCPPGGECWVSPWLNLQAQKVKLGSGQVWPV